MTNILTSRQIREPSIERLKSGATLPRRRYYLLPSSVPLDATAIQRSLAAALRSAWNKVWNGMETVNARKLSPGRRHDLAFILIHT